MIFGQKLFSLLLLSVVMSGCAGAGGNPRDPFEPMNRTVFQFNGKADRYVMKPVAEGYRDVTPQGVRNSVRNFFSNLGEVSSMVNYSLQGKPEPAFYSFSRFALNSTAGMLGFFDVTGEEERRFPGTSFGDTFARWGWKNSSYLVLPLFGPSTVRDGAGLATGAAFQQFVVYGDPENHDAILVGNVVGAISVREKLLGLEDTVNSAALDSYSYVRDGWLQIRSKTTGDAPVQSSDDDIDIDDLMK